MGCGRWLILVVILWVMQMPSGPFVAHSAEPPSYQLLRYEERYTYLRDPAQRSDFFDPIKYIPLSSDGEVDLSFGGQVRLRHSYTHNPTWGDDPQIDTGQFLQRYVVHGDLHLGQKARVFVQLLSAMEDSSGEASPVDEDRLALFQAFADLRFRLGASATLTLRPGRQVWRFGSQRLIGIREGPNVRRRFDAIRLTLNLPGWELNGLVGQPTENTPGIFDDDTNDEQTIWGLYTVWRPKVASVEAIDLYYLGFRQKQAIFDQGAGKETRHTAGVRVSGGRAGWDYNWEGMVQWGTFGDGDILAWTVATVTGYTWTDVWFRPRLGLSVNMASGDRDPNDRDLQTFNPLFPRGNYFSELALLGPRNFFNLDPSLTLQFAPRVIVTTNVNFFWRLSTDDGVYSSSGQLLRSGQDSGSRYVGSAVSLLSEWQVNRHLALSLSYTHVFPGRFIRDTGPDESIDFVETTVTFLF